MGINVRGLVILNRFHKTQIELFAPFELPPVVEVVAVDEATAPEVLLVPDDEDVVPDVAVEEDEAVVEAVVEAGGEGEESIAVAVFVAGFDVCVLTSSKEVEV